jgi:hypothetical protein
VVVCSAAEWIMSAMGVYLSGELLEIEDGEAGTRNAPDARSGGLPVTA